MDALVKAALDKVNNVINDIHWNKMNQTLSDGSLEQSIAKAIHSVDALKSALKAL